MRIQLSVSSSPVGGSNQPPGKPRDLFHHLDEVAFPSSPEKSVKQGPRRAGYYSIFFAHSAWSPNFRGFDRFERLCMDESYLYARTGELICRACIRKILRKEDQGGERLVETKRQSSTFYDY